MKTTDDELLRAVETLIVAIQAFGKSAETEEQQERAAIALKCLGALGEAVLSHKEIFGIEPWHPLVGDVPLARPGEMLLRLKDSAGQPLPPYPFVMACYESGMTTHLDTVLFLCALNQMRDGDEKQVSVNVSARSLLDGDFVRAVAMRLEALNLNVPEEKVIMEIHESAPNLAMNPKVLKLFKDHKVGFALDDVGLQIKDVIRLSEFEGIARYIKIDRHSVNAQPDKAHSLEHVVAFIKTIFPEAILVAEGVQSPEHAHEICTKYPDIHYAQGLYLPGRAEFSAAYGALRG